MRHHLAGLAFGLVVSTAISTAANAADMAGPAPPVLRGVLPASERAIDWSGFYFGANGSYSNTSNTTSGTTGVPPILRNLAIGTTLGADMDGRNFPETRTDQKSAVSFGGFVGYNFVFEDTVLGLEADYSRTRAKGDVTSTGGGRFTEVRASPNSTPPVSGIDRNWTAFATSKFNITDLGSVRARVGYSWGNALPYFTGGFAVMRGGFERSGRIEGTFLDSTSLAVIGQASTLQDVQKTSSRLYFGYALGAGIDYAFSPNIFLRAELQHLRFADVGGFNIAVNQAKVGAAIKY